MSLPQLVEGQLARLDMGESLPCRVIGFSGPDVVLSLEAQPREPPEAGGPAHLVLESDGRMHSVRGCLGVPAGDEVVLLTDGIRLGQRRVFSRAPLSLPVRVSADGREWTTVTRDVSARGLALARAGIELGDGLLKVRIQVADHEVVATAIAVRVASAEVGLRFEEIGRDDRLLLASLALAYHRRK